MENNTDKLALERIHALKAERIEISSLPPGDALDKILSARHSAALVHSFPEEDFYLLIQEIGSEDALPLLSLASSKQLNFILDQEIWQKDRINISAATQWFRLILSADPNRFVNWLMQEKIDLLRFYLYKNIKIKVREHDQDPSDFNDDYFTLDDVFYVKLLDNITGLSDHIGQEDTEPDVIQTGDKELVNQLLERIAAIDHSAYQKILMESVHILPAESEEEAFRWRNIRLSEKGFLPFDEAIGIYQPLRPGELEQIGQKINKSKFALDSYNPVPLSPLKMMGRDNIFSDALAIIPIDELMNEIQAEFVALCNQIIVADQKSVKNREDLKKIVKKTCGYIIIGLERLIQEEPHLQQAVDLISKYPISQIFKVGFGCALTLKWRAERWVKKNWFSNQGLSLSFWGEEWLGVIGGLLIKKPLFFDNYQTGVLYREFESMGDIDMSENILTDIIAVDELLSLSDIKIKSPSAYEFLSYKNLILTLWARNYLNINEALIPLTLTEFKRFYKDLWVSDTIKRTAQHMKTSFLSFLADKTGLTDYEITKQVGQILEHLFNEIENEFGQVPVKDLDPRFIHLFLVKK